MNGCLHQRSNVARLHLLWKEGNRGGGGGGGLKGIYKTMQKLDVTSYATAFFQNLKAGITSHTNSKILTAPTPPYFSATGKDRYKLLAQRSGLAFRCLFKGTL